MDEIAHTVALAKRAGNFTRSELFNKMYSLAQKHHLAPGVSPQQAFARFVMTDEGRELLAIQKSMDGRDIEPEKQVTKSGGEDDWDKLLRLTKNAAGCSYSEAIDAALSTEAGRYAFAKRKRADRIATRQFTVADMQCLDSIAGENELVLEMRKASSRSKYEDVFDKIKRAYPHLTDSQAHDFARQSDPQAWADHKTQKLGSGGVMPQARGQREVSGEEPPKPTTGREGRAPAQRQQTHGSRTPPGPNPVPEKMSDTPTVKVMARRLGRQRAVELYKQMPGFVQLILDNVVCKEVDALG